MHDVSKQRLFTSPFLWGFGLCYAWKALTAPYCSEDAFRTLMQVLVPLAVVFLWKGIARINKGQGIAWASAAVGVVATIAVYMLEIGAVQDLQGGIQSVASWAVTGVYMLFSLLWSEAYARTGITQASVALSCSYLFGAVVYFAASALPFELHGGIAAMLPILSAMCLYVGLLKMPEVPAPRMREWGSSAGGGRCEAFPFDAVPWRIVLVVALFSFAAGVNRTRTTPAVDIFSAGIAGLAMIVIVLAFAKKFSVFSVYKIALTVMMACLVLGVISGEQSPFSQVCVNASYAFAMMLMVLLLCDKAHRFGAPALLLNAVGRTCTGVAIVLGGLLGERFALASGADTDGNVAVIYVVTASAVALAILCWVASGKLFEDVRQPRDSENGKDSADSGDTGNMGDVRAASAAPVPSDAEASRLLGSILRARCAELVKEYHLSKREAEVLFLMALGKSTRGIGETLVISGNTVKTHVRNIYSKLGIHSRGEFDILIGIEREADPLKAK